jgi:hypothetical protein
MTRITAILILCVIVVSLSGCGDLNAIYDDNATIAKSGDSYSISGAGSIKTGNELSVNTATITGTRTIWRYNTDSDVDVTFYYSLSVTAGGKAKLVLITPDDEVIILFENTDNASNIEMQSITLSLKAGNNRIKIVGYDAPKIDLKLSIEVGILSW